MFSHQRSCVFSPLLTCLLPRAHVSTTAYFSVHHHRSPSVHQSSRLVTGAHMFIKHSSPVCSSELLCLFTTMSLSVHHTLCDFSSQLTRLLSSTQVSVHQSLSVFTTVDLYTRPHVCVCVCVCVGCACVHVCVCMVTKAHLSLHQSSFPYFFWGYMRALVYKEKVT